MRIAFWCGDFYPNLGGATSVINDLACELLRLAHQVTIITRQWPGFHSSENYHGYSILRLDFPVPYVELRRSGLPLIFRSPPLLFRIAKILRGYDTVCIGLLDLSSFYLLALRPLVRFRLILYLHGGEIRKLPYIDWGFRMCLMAALRSADAIIAVSPELASEACALAPSIGSKIHVITNGIDTEQVKRVTSRHHPREYIAFVGRLVEEKQAGVLIEAFQRVSARIPDVDLLIAGAGYELEMLRTKARSARIHLLGRLEREQAQALIKGCLFLVLPSRTEGFPIVAIESLAAGKPVIGSNIPAIAQAVEDGVTGALFPVGDVEALAILLEKYSRDRCALAALAAQVESLDPSYFSMNTLIHKHLAIYKAGTLPKARV